MCAKLLQSCLTLCDPMDCNSPSSSVHGILQARILEWATTHSSRGSFQPRDQTHTFCGSCIAGRFFTTGPLWKPKGHHTCNKKHSFILDHPFYRTDLKKKITCSWYYVRTLILIWLIHYVILSVFKMNHEVSFPKEDRDSGLLTKVLRWKALRYKDFKLDVYVW